MGLRRPRIIANVQDLPAQRRLTLSFVKAQRLLRKERVERTNPTLDNV